MNISFSPFQKELLAKVSALATKRALRVFVVGGAVRDIFLGSFNAEHDLDFVVEGDAMAFAADAASEWGGVLQRFERFGTAKVSGLLAAKEGAQEVDFAASRTETYGTPGVLPTVVPASIEADLKRRDFSVNALAISVQVLKEWADQGASSPATLTSHVLDYFGGLSDLEARQIVVLHSKSFRDDPTRIFRACRYAQRIKGRLSAESETWLSEAVREGALKTVSSFRKLSEIKKIIDEQDPAAIFGQLGEYSVFTEFELFPEISTGKILSALSVLPSLVSGERRYGAALRIFYYSWPELKGSELFRSFGLGKKFFSIADAERDLKKDLAQISEIGLLAHAAISEPEIRASLVIELKRRGFCDSV